MFSSADGSDRPTTLDIWLWKLEEAVIRNAVEHRKTEPSFGEPGSYDPFYLYAHRNCLMTTEQVQRAPDRVLFEALGLNGNVWGWLEFMVRDHLWFSLSSANWGHPTLIVGEDLELATKDQRRAEVVSHFLNLTKERGDNPLPDFLRWADAIKAQLRKEGEEPSEEQFTARLREHNELVYFFYAYAEKPNPPALLSAPDEPKYTGEFRVGLARKIRQAAERRRQNWNAPYSCSCDQQDKNS